MIFLRAGENYAAQIAQLYSMAVINKDNYRRKLMVNPNDFSKTGGIFAGLCESEILSEMKHSYFYIIEIDGAVMAVMWISPHDPAFEIKEPSHIFARDIIIHPNAPKGTGKLMFYKVFSKLREMGYTHSIGEVYKIIHNGTELLNERSFHGIINIAAKHIGENPPRLIKLADCEIEVTVHPQIVHFDYDTVLPVLESILKKRGLII
jgi:hypothetical protein